MTIKFIMEEKRDVAERRRIKAKFKLTGTWIPAESDELCCHKKCRKILGVI